MSVLGSITFPLVGNDSKLVTALAAVPVAVILAHLVPYLIDPFNQRRIPGPLLARFSDLWLGWTASQGHRSEVVHELHQKYGTVQFEHTTHYSSSS
jgi:benzoate 4-monooxygenase